MYNQWCMQNPAPCAGNVTPRLLQRPALWAATVHRQCWNGYNEFRTVQPDSFVEERSMTTSLLYWKSCIGCQYKLPTYKLLTIAYSVMHGLAPEYLAELLDRHHPRRVLRSASAELFSVPFSQTVRHGNRRFSVVVATLWNQFPNSVRMIETLPLFRTHLKTHLFRVAFS